MQEQHNEDSVYNISQLAKIDSQDAGADLTKMPCVERQVLFSELDQQIPTDLVEQIEETAGYPSESTHFAAWKEQNPQFANALRTVVTWAMDEIQASTRLITGLDLLSYEQKVEVRQYVDSLPRSIRLELYRTIHKRRHQENTGEFEWALISQKNHALGMAANHIRNIDLEI